MALIVTGSPKGESVDLDTAAKEGVRHTVRLLQGAVANFAITDKYHTHILASSDPPISPNVWQTTWRPVPGQQSEAGVVRHELGMVFAHEAAKKYGWTVEHVDAAGNVLAVVRDVQYEATPPTTVASDSIKIYI